MQMPPMGLKVITFAALAAMVSTPASARAPGMSSYQIRMMKCVGADAEMEIYVPQAAVFNHDPLSMPPIIGWYTLDLTGANKGKMLEPVRVSVSPDKKTLILDQYTRGLTPTRIPIAGGTVDFDQRFGKQAKCDAFGWHQAP